MHCKAGLGRTGTNIAAYMMKHYGYTAKEATAWSRVCRPGCVVGPQQQYLMSVEARMFVEGEKHRERMGVLRGSAQQQPSRSMSMAVAGAEYSGNGNGRHNDKIFSSLRHQGGNTLQRNELDCARPNTSAGVMATTGKYSDAGTQQRQYSGNTGANGNGHYRQLFGAKNKSSADSSKRDKLPAQRSPNSVRNHLVISNNFVGNEADSNTAAGSKMPALSPSNKQDGTNFGSVRHSVNHDSVSRPSTSAGISSTYNSALRSNGEHDTKRHLVSHSYHNRSATPKSERDPRSSSNSSTFSSHVNSKFGRPKSSYGK